MANPLLDLIPNDWFRPKTKTALEALCVYGHRVSKLKKYEPKTYSCRFCRKTAADSYEESLAALRPELITEWHPTRNGELMPEHVLPRAGLKVWWLLPCGHEDFRSPHKRKEGRCVTCDAGQLLVGFNDLATTDPAIAAQWHPTLNAAHKPQDFTRGSNHKAWWVCSKEHVWDTTVKNRTKGRNCRFCGKKASACEIIVEDALRNVFSTTIEKNKRRLRHNGKLMELDYILPELSLAFEVQDFATHSKTSDAEPGAFLGWRGLKKGPTYHELKRQVALEQLGFTVIDLWEDLISNRVKLEQFLVSVRDNLPAVHEG